MIRLIASDMDGTLLDDEKRLPKDFFPVLDRLIEKKIIFTVASGRTYTAVEHLLPEKYREKISYICDNGACTLLNGKVTNVFPLERDVYEKVISVCAEAEDFTVIVCAESGVYHLDLDEEFTKDVGRFYKFHKTINDFLDVNDTIYKLAICDKKGALRHGKPLLEGVFGDKLNIQASGEFWMDVMAGGVSKGAALRALQKTLGVTPEETMAFGDYFNDADMLMAADYSFCMENGHEDVKKLCRFIAPNNNSGGVTKCIRKFVL